MMWDLIIVGGGAAGFFGGVNYIEKNSHKKVLILEASNKLLAKVKISGGGRCNVTHACFDPKELVQAYPRGKKELLSAFNQFFTGDTFDWFEKRGVPLKIEDDGRSFPTSNSSQSIVDCLYNGFVNAGGKIETGKKVTGFKSVAGGYELQTSSKVYGAKSVLWTTGGTESTYKLLENHNIPCVPRVPSLFSCNVPNKKLHQLSGLSVPHATLTFKKGKIESSGPLLITHWGFSGPAALKLSALGAVHLHAEAYKFNLEVNWLGEPLHVIENQLIAFQKTHANKKINKSPFDVFASRLWLYLLQRAKLNEDAVWQHVSKAQMMNLAAIICQDLYQVSGKTTFKEEFVTAGGIDLKAINFKTLELKNLPNFFVAGEVINVDAITGGYNFQNAWTTSWIAAQHIA